MATCQSRICKKYRIEKYQQAKDICSKVCGIFMRKCFRTDKNMGLMFIPLSISKDTW